MKHINRIKLRKICVLEENYLWKRGHFHEEEYEDSECVEKVIIYLEGYKKAPLQLFFRQDDNKFLTRSGGTWQVGYPDAGIIWFFALKLIELNSFRAVRD